MGQIDALIAARVATPSGISANEIPVWNGTTWVRSSVTRINVGGLNQPMISTGLFSSGPPSSPTNGDIWIATGTAYGNPFRWQFQYDSAQTTYKWVFIGGVPAGQNSGSNYSNTIAATFQIPGTFAFTASRAGTYIVRTQARWTNTTGAAAEFAVSASVNGVGGVGVYADNAVVPNGMSLHTSMETDTGVVGAGQVIDVAYYSSSIAGTPVFSNRSFWLIPKQVI